LLWSRSRRWLKARLRKKRRNSCLQFKLALKATPATNPPVQREIKNAQDQSYLSGFFSANEIRIG